MGWTAASTHVPCSEWGWGKVGLAPYLKDGIHIVEDYRLFRYMARCRGTAKQCRTRREAQEWLQARRWGRDGR